MDKNAGVLIKVCGKTTSFIVFRDNKIVLWDTVAAGEGLIISDVANCLRIKLNDAEQLTKAKGVCLSTAVGVADEQILAEIIEARVEQIYTSVKEVLLKANLLEQVSCFFITKDDNYIPDMDKLLNRVMGVPARSVDMAKISLCIKSTGQLGKFIDQYF